jgi:hypothetical protein
MQLMLVRDNLLSNGLQNKLFVFDLSEYALVFLEGGREETKKTILLNK